MRLDVGRVSASKGCADYKLLFIMRKANKQNLSFTTVSLLQIGSDQEGQRVDNYLFRIGKGVPKSHIYKAIRSGQVRVNGGRVRHDYRLALDDELRIPPLRAPDPTSKQAAPPAQFPVVYEDDVLLAINKPAGVAVHGGSGVSFGVIEQLRAAQPEHSYLELVHRLDRDTSGLLLVAKRRRALVGLQEAFRNAQIERHYVALVVGDWVNDRQHLRQPLLRWTTASGERRVRVDDDGKRAHTIITLKKRFGRFSLLSAELRTGRTHQIRVHLANQGYKIVGDDKYGRDDINQEMARLGFKRMFLHAARLAFQHPLSERHIMLEAPLDESCQQLLTYLENT